MEQQKCTIIGAGPAGYTAAIYAARANLTPLMLTGAQPGGQLMITNDVENFPGYPKGINGPQMMEEFKEQAVRFGTDIRFNQVIEIDFSQHPYVMKLDNGSEIASDSIIVATGASAKWLGLESEQRLNGSGVSACAVCDGFFYRGKEVVIVGGGDSACEEALYLSNLCPTVHMIVRKDHLRASQIMQDRVLKKENIKVYWNTETLEVLGENEVVGVKVMNNHTTEEIELKADGFFVAIGHTPNSSFLQPDIQTDEQGYIITKSDSTETNIPGVFACGDVQDKKFRQAVTAAGSGCMAALEAEKYVMSLEIKLEKQL
tara:strand:+ start:126146 stop:127093 length:948 start_codon:yes stop_codon:yes gene_type:complete